MVGWVKAELLGRRGNLESVTITAPPPPPNKNLNRAPDGVEWGWVILLVWGSICWPFSGHIVLCLLGTVWHRLAAFDVCKAMFTLYRIDYWSALKIISDRPSVDI